MDQLKKFTTIGLLKDYGKNNIMNYRERLRLTKKLKP
jgi:hypothetical protein